MLNKRSYSHVHCHGVHEKKKKNRISRECCQYSRSFGIKTKKNHSSAVAKLSKSMKVNKSSNDLYLALQEQQSIVDALLGT